MVGNGRKLRRYEKAAPHPQHCIKNPLLKVALADLPLMRSACMAITSIMCRRRTVRCSSVMGFMLRVLDRADRNEAPHLTLIVPVVAGAYPILQLGTDVSRRQTMPLGEVLMETSSVRCDVASRGGREPLTFNQRVLRSSPSAFTTSSPYTGKGFMEFLTSAALHLFFSRVTPRVTADKTRAIRANTGLGLRW